METLRQLGWLFYKSVPTIVLFLFFYWFLRANFFKPMQRTLARRDALITKARAEAEAVQSAAKEKTQAYEDALSKARAGVFAEQEAARQAAFEERAKLLQQARAQAQDIVHQEKERIGREFDSARAQLEEQSAGLARAIAARILEGSPEPLRDMR